MKIWVRIAALVLTLATLVSACASSQDTSADETQVYKVTKSTGLYDAANLDAGLIAELPVGTLLKPANNAKRFKCRALTEFGTTYTLCHAEVIKGGLTGWVLRQWTEPE